MPQGICSGIEHSEGHSTSLSGARISRDLSSWANCESSYDLGRASARLPAFRTALQQQSTPSKCFSATAAHCRLQKIKS